MKTIYIEDAEFDVPEVAFAFSDTKAYIYTEDPYIESVKLKGRITEGRDLHNGRCTFDLKPFFDGVINPQRINLVNGNPSLNPCIIDQEIEVEVKYEDHYASEKVMQRCIWGSHGVNDSYLKHRKLTWNPNYPFTIDLFLNKQYTGEDGYGYSDVHITCDNKDCGAVTIPVKDRFTRYDISSFVTTTPERNIQLSVLGHICVDNGVLKHGLHTLEIEVDNRTSGVYLRWLDRLGRLNYKLFKKVEEISEVSIEREYIQSNMLSTKLYNYTGEFSNAGDCRYQKGVEQKMIRVGIGGQDQNQMEELKTLIGSSFVDMYLGERDGKPVWQRVIVAPGSYSFKQRSRQEFGLSLILPSNNIQHV